MDLFFIQPDQGNGLMFFIQSDQKTDLSSVFHQTKEIDLFCAKQGKWLMFCGDLFLNRKVNWYNL